MEEKKVCSYTKVYQNGIGVWNCDQCGHIEYAPFRFKDWIYCPYCGKAIIRKEGIKTPMD